MQAAVYQIFYAPSQARALDPGFRPLDIAARNNPRWCEYQVFLDHLASAVAGSEEYVGYVSWKFFAKTRLRASDLLAHLQAVHPVDVCFVNPYETSVAGLYKNVWTQLESVFPGVLPVLQNCFARAGYAVELRSLVMPPDQMAFCNYWVGTRDFWREYMEFTRPLYRHLDHELDDATRRRFLSMDRKNHLGLNPHIMERMFSTLLAIRPGRFRVSRLPLPEAMRQIAPEVESACNRAKTELALVQDRAGAGAALDAQDVLLTHLLRCKQAADKARSPRRRWMPLLSRWAGRAAGPGGRS